jgi:alpha-L-rhamnosidase
MAVLFAVSCPAITVENLDCEYRSNPLGVDVPQPALSWTLQSDRRGERQTAYEILAASSKSLLKKDNGDLWDSGKISSGETIQISYAGKKLDSSQQVFWKVRTWDADGKVSAWSEPANWTMGILSDADWQNAK